MSTEEMVKHINIMDEEELRCALRKIAEYNLEELPLRRVDLYLVILETRGLMVS